VLLGEELGAVLGDGVRPDVGAELSAELGSKLGAELGAVLGDGVGPEVGAELGAELGERPLQRSDRIASPSSCCKRPIRLISSKRGADG